MTLVCGEEQGACRAGGWLISFRGSGWLCGATRGGRVMSPGSPFCRSHREGRGGPAGTLWAVRRARAGALNVSVTRRGDGVGFSPPSLPLLLFLIPRLCCDCVYIAGTVSAGSLLPKGGIRLPARLVSLPCRVTSFPHCKMAAGLPSSGSFRVSWFLQ